jgi:pimeloyl-ACP methyl ester carboxylesterase
MRAAIIALFIAGLAATPAPAAPYHDRHITSGAGRVFVREYPGAGPAIVLMHGFPDNHHLYDRLAPKLRGRHVVLFDFLGWGASDHPPKAGYTFDGLTRDLDAVMRKVVRGPAVLVGHDASGPPLLDWALEHRERLAGIVLLNTFYGAAPTLLPPDAIGLFSNPDFSRLQKALAASPEAFAWMFRWQVGSFVTDPVIRHRFVETVLRQFVGPHSAMPAFLGLNRDLNRATIGQTLRQPRLAELATVPTRIVFGDRDPYLNPGVARTLHDLIPGSRLTLIHANHFVQIDAPDQVARAILAVP